MTSNLFTKRLLYLIIFSFAALFGLTGCRQHDYKAEADEAVYNIIDQKWQDDFGSKVNYKISDTEPCPNDIKIEKVVPASGILNLPQAVAIATAHNREYQTQKEALYTMALDLKLFRHEFETQFFSGTRQGYGKAGNAEGVGGEADFGFDWLLASGTRIGTKVSLAWFKVLTGDLRGGLASILSATLTQPLLRGSSRKVVMENLTQAERNTIYQIRLFNRFRKTFVVSVISQYYLVLQQFDFLKNAENNYMILNDIYEQTEKLVSAGRLPRYELDRVHQDKLRALDELVLAEKDYMQALDEFKITLSLPTRTELKLEEKEIEALSIISKPPFPKIKEQMNEDLTTEVLDLLEEELKLIALIQPGQDDYNQNDIQTQDTYAQLEKIHKQVLDELKINPSSPNDTELQSEQDNETDFSEKDVVETALALRLDLANKADAIFDAERKVLVAADNLRGELNLFVGVDATSLASSSELPGVGALDDDFVADRNRPTPLRRLRDNNPLRNFQDQSEIGIDLELPLDRVAEQNIYRKALITLSQRQREYEEMTDWVTLEVRQAYRDLTEAAERYRVQSEGLELAKKRLKNTFLLLRYGRASSRRVLNAQDDLFNTQNAATEALMGYTIATLNFYRDTGVLQVRPDGMWEY
ncbi:MAG: TolC family protein [Planctomycetota bacterium]|jgi:outer membrane protein TolC